VTNRDENRLAGRLPEPEDWIQRPWAEEPFATWTRDAPALMCMGCRYVTPSSGVGLRCPLCGGESWFVTTRRVSERIPTKEFRTLSIRRGLGPPLWKGKDGEQRQSDGTWASVHQVVDRSTHRYRKQVVRDDGTVVRDVDEPLQEHRDRGDARPDRRKAKGPG
jgi:hypothetical protein